MKHQPENPNLRVLAGESFQLSDGKVAEYRRRWKDNPTSHIVEDFPIHLDIESTSVCNLRCAFCASTYESYTYGYMPLGRFRRIIDEGTGLGLCSAKLNFRGEPLLHDGIDAMVAYAKDRGLVDVFFNTNATRLTEEIGRKLIDAGLDRLIVSFEGTTKDVYEANRVGADFDATVDNVRRFAELKRRLNVDHLKLRLQTVGIDTSEIYLEDYRAFWGEWADEITCVDLRDEKGSRADFPTKSADIWECPYPWLRLCVTWDGEVLTCPNMNCSLERYEWRSLGNVDSTPIADMWTGEVMERIRSVHMAHEQHTTDPCRYCSFRQAELDKLARKGGVSE